MTRALYWRRMQRDRVRCELCPFDCLIAPGRRGVCGVRENRSGVLETLVYGRMASWNVDPIEKKPLFHFFPGALSFSFSTVGCNFNCQHCQNHAIAFAPKKGRPVRGEETRPEQIVDAAEAHGCRIIAYTYTEPTIFFEYAYDTARLAHERGMRNVFVTNGYIAEGPIRRIAPYLDAANVDLKAFSDAYYKRECVGARHAPVLDALRLMKALGVWVEVTTLVVPTWNDRREELERVARWILEALGPGTPWHVTRFFPHYRRTDLPPTPLEALALAREAGLDLGLRYVYNGNVPGGDWENTFCPGCGGA
ncbi:MAG: AmmeMemoRadiSam system radical SAM enzyme, partial [Nitrospinota bacterium]